MQLAGVLLKARASSLLQAATAASASLIRVAQSCASTSEAGAQVQPDQHHDASAVMPANNPSLAAAFLYEQSAKPRAQPLPHFLPRISQRPLPLMDALRLVKARARARFPETVEAHVRLKVDPRRGDQMVRGAAVLPHSFGKQLRIAVFAMGAAADAARAAGADIVGADELVQSVLASKGKSLDFNACLATPDMMPRLVQLGRFLGPKGLMPNPKMGTLTEDVVAAIEELRRGRVEFKMDRTAIVHAPIGRVTFDDTALYANMGALTAALLTVKPEAIKGGLARYVRSVSLSSTMGPGIAVEPSSLLAAVDAAVAAMQSGQS